MKLLKSRRGRKGLTYDRFRDTLSVTFYASEQRNVGKSEVLGESNNSVGHERYPRIHNVQLQNALHFERSPDSHKEARTQCEVKVTF